MKPRYSAYWPRVGARIYCDTRAELAALKAMIRQDAKKAA